MGGWIRIGPFGYTFRDRPRQPQKWPTTRAGWVELVTAGIAIYAAGLIVLLLGPYGIPAAVIVMVIYFVNVAAYRRRQRGRRDR